MSIHFHKLRIKDTRKETSDCVSISFDIPDELKEHFVFKQGQSLTMRTWLNGEEVRRTYSLCSSPMENEWRVAVKKVEGGLFSGFANEKLKKGDELEVMEPVGNFYTELVAGHKKNYLAFAAGSGITPVISIIKTTLATESESHFTLIYGNKSRNSIIFFEELEALKNKYIDRFNLVHILSREKQDTLLNDGKIDPAKLDLLGKMIDYKKIDEFFICGPEQMIFCVKDYLESKGAGKKNIHFELFTSPAEKQRIRQKATSDITTDSGASSLVTIKLDGRSFDFKLPLNQDITLLDAALQQGADLPYACKGGMCCTCKAKLVDGKVDMDVHWGLEDEEIEKGFILTCQSHPKTERIIIDFDIK